METHNGPQQISSEISRILTILDWDHLIEGRQQIYYWHKQLLIDIMQVMVYNI